MSDLCRCVMGCSRQPGKYEAQEPHAALSDVQPPTERHT